MNRREHLLVILAEECSEVQKEICKILRFGYDHMKWLRLQNEYNEIVALVEMIADEGISIYAQEHIKQKKKDKVEKYLLESKKLGTLTEE